jgi:hypothetical protein
MVLRRFLILLAVGQVFFAAPAARAEVPLEYQIKAAFIFNFAKFVEWPPKSFQDGSSPIVIGVLGENPFGDALEATVRGQILNGRPLVIKHSRNVADLLHCHILFVSRSESGSVQQILELLQGSSTLTVSDMDGFTENGGAIHFVEKDHKIRFEINPKVAQRANLKISSKLLNLARQAGTSRPAYEGR